MGNLQKIEEFTKHKVLEDNDIRKLTIICRITSVVCHIPCSISLFVYIFQDSKLQLGQKIEFIICISLFIYGSSHYLPMSSDHQWLCYFQCIISFGIEIIIAYLAMIYSYVALIIFRKPKTVNSRFNIFVIYFSPILLFIPIILLILYRVKLAIFFGLTVYPLDSHSRLLNCSIVFVFLLITIVNNVLLIVEIKQFKRRFRNIDSCMEEKLRIFIKKLIFNIIGIIFVCHYNLPIGILTSCGLIDGNNLHHFGYFLYLYINKAMLTLVFWFLYIFSVNFWHKFLILIRIEKKENFVKTFEKESKAMEYNIEEGNEVNQNNETMNISMRELDSIPKGYEDETL